MAGMKTVSLGCEAPSLSHINSTIIDITISESTILYLHPSFRFEPHTILRVSVHCRAPRCFLKTHTSRPTLLP